ALDVQPGQVIADLYGGAGLFSRFIADGVEEDGAVLSVEASPGASRDARKNLYDKKQAYVLTALPTESLVPGCSGLMRQSPAVGWIAGKLILYFLIRLVPARVVQQ